MSDQLGGRDMDKKPWMGAGVLVPCLVAAALGATVVSVYAMPARVLAGLPGFVPHFGRSLGMRELGGSRVVLELAASEPGAVEKTMAIARGRVRALGVREARVSQIAANRILVEAPGYDDPDKLGALVGKNGRLTIQIVDPDPELGGALPGRIPPDEEKVPSGAGYYPPEYVVQKAPVVTGSMLKDAEFTFAGDQPGVAFKLDEVGTRHLAAATAVNTGRQFAIILDGKVVTAPVMRTPITGGRGVITGHFTAESAEAMATLLRSGPLPGPVKVVEATKVAPSA